MNSTPLTFNYHIEAHVIYPSGLYFWCLCSCAFVSVLLSARYFRWMRLQDFSLSLAEIDYAPVLLGFLVQFLIAVVFPLFLIFFGKVLIHPIKILSWVRIVPFYFLILSISGYGLAGAMVWLSAKRNRLGQVVFTGLITIGLQLLVFLYHFYKGGYISHFYPLSLCVKTVLIGTMFILGARLGKNAESEANESFEQ